MKKTTETQHKTRTRKDRRPKIIEEAIRAFGKHGFKGATLSSIAESVGLSEPGLLHYYPSKVHLLMDVLDLRDKKDIEKNKTAISDGKKTIFEALEDLVARNEKKPEIVKLFTVLVGESFEPGHPSHEFFVNRYARIHEQLCASLSAEIDIENQIDPNELCQLTSIIVAVMDGLQIQWMLHPETVNLSKTYKYFSGIIQTYIQETFHT
jgi:AcrR family transcriptional regulator